MGTLIVYVLILMAIAIIHLIIKTYKRELLGVNETSLTTTFNF